MAHPLFCVCARCSFRVAMEHKAADEGLGHDWARGGGCGCAACRGARAVLAKKNPEYAPIAKIEKRLKRFL